LNDISGPFKPSFEELEGRGGVWRGMEVGKWRVDVKIVKIVKIMPGLGSLAGLPDWAAVRGNLSTGVFVESTEFLCCRLFTSVMIRFIFAGMRTYGR
jgi:hypothetical protein